MERVGERVVKIGGKCCLGEVGSVIVGWSEVVEELVKGSRRVVA